MITRHRPRNTKTIIWSAVLFVLAVYGVEPVMARENAPTQIFKTRVTCDTMGIPTLAREFQFTDRAWVADDGTILVYSFDPLDDSTYQFTYTPRPGEACDLKKGPGFNREDIDTILD